MTQTQQRLNVAILGFHHESNTFAPVAASLDRFLAGGVSVGTEIIARYGESQATMAGFLELMQNSDIQCVPLIHADLNPMGTITEEAFEHLVGRMITGLTNDGPWDVVLLALHGAAVAAHKPDADGEILARVRKALGPNTVIGVALDMHANISHQMMQNCTVLNAYLTNPHIDPRIRAREIAEISLATARGQINPVMAIASPPLAIGILRQGTSDWPMSQLIERATELADLDKVLSISVVEGFPYADVQEMGMSFIAITDNDKELADKIVKQLADEAWSLRNDFVGQATEIDAALINASTSVAKPVVLLDVGDNVGGGSPADSTHILAAAQRLKIRNLFHSLCDPQAVQHCISAGVGGNVELKVGAHTDDLHGYPVAVTGLVRHLDNGVFEDPGVTHGGFRFFDAGPRALLESHDGHFILLTSLPMGNTSRVELTSVGINPLDLQVIVAKGVHSPRGAFEPIAAEMIQVNSPGCTSADLSQLKYSRRRNPMFPFEKTAPYGDRENPVA